MEVLSCHNNVKLQTGPSLHGSVTCISCYNNVTLQRERERERERDRERERERIEYVSTSKRF